MISQLKHYGYYSNQQSNDDDEYFVYKSVDGETLLKLTSARWFNNEEEALAFHCDEYHHDKVYISELGEFVERVRKSYTVYARGLYEE
jgi:hypothetical protein